MRPPSRRPDWGLILLLTAVAAFLGFQAGYGLWNSSGAAFVIRAQYPASEEDLLEGNDSPPASADREDAAWETPAISDGEAAADKAALRVDLNTADAEELQRLPGIGPARAEAIIAYREERGMFVAVDELLYVPGIGEGIYNDIKDYVYITIPSTMPS